MKKIVTSIVIVLVVAFATAAEIRNVAAKQRYPWNGKVDITYEVVGDVTAGRPPENLFLFRLAATDYMTGSNYVASTTALSGDMGFGEGTHSLVWDMDKEDLSFKSSNVVFRVSFDTVPALYCVIDLSGGTNASSYPVSYLADVPSGGWTDEYKTTKLVLRRIEPGPIPTYDAAITKPFYCGVFEVTQKQYELVTGGNPSDYKGYKRPVENVSWDTIRGDSTIYDWPNSANVDPNSFVGRIQARTGLTLDLPTVAQWEYACRAGTTSKYNNGGNAEDDLKQLGRYCHNQSDGKGGYSEHTVVGSYQPNTWGLYDMHGNVWEWCIDYGGLFAGNDPVTYSGVYRVARGGDWRDYAAYCTSSSSASIPSSSRNGDYFSFGFRLVRTLSN